MAANREIVYPVGAAVAVLAEYVADFMDDNDDHDWEKITVNIEEFRTLGDPSFRRHFRLTKPVFELLYVEIYNYMVQNNRIVRERRPLSHALLMVLWILATPETFRATALRFGVYPSEVHYNYVCIITCLREMGPRYIKWPSEEGRMHIKRNLERISNFPGIVGIMDGCHIAIPAPVEEKAAYRNYHHGYSIKFQAVCDDRFLIRDVYIGEAGSLHDARIFRRSPLCRKILTEPNLISDGEHIIADSAYPLLDKVLIPFANNGHLTPLQRNYNHRLSQVRARIENTFAKVDSLWRRLFFLPCRTIEYAVDHIAAVLVLSNFKILNGQEIGQAGVINNIVMEDENEAAVDENGLHQGVLRNDIHDPYIPLNVLQLWEDASLRGDQKRWDICNQLPLQ